MPVSPHAPLCGDPHLPTAAPSSSRHLFPTQFSLVQNLFSSTHSPPTFPRFPHFTTPSPGLSPTWWFHLLVSETVNPSVSRAHSRHPRSPQSMCLPVSLSLTRLLRGQQPGPRPQSAELRSPCRAPAPLIYTETGPTNPLGLAGWGAADKAICH